MTFVRSHGGHALQSDVAYDFGLNLPFIAFHRVSFQLRKELGDGAWIGYRLTPKDLWVNAAAKEYTLTTFTNFPKTIMNGSAAGHDKSMAGYQTYSGECQNCQKCAFLKDYGFLKTTPGLPGTKTTTISIIIIINFCAKFLSLPLGQQQTVRQKSGSYVKKRPMVKKGAAGTREVGVHGKALLRHLSPFLISCSWCQL